MAGGNRNFATLSYAAVSMSNTAAQLSPEKKREEKSATARFFASEATGSILLLICTLVALIWANSAWSSAYFHILDAKNLAFTWNESRFALSFGHWINDGLMALFFFVVGLEN